MFHFGVDYYPEQWPEERWELDAQLMEDAAFNLVRLAEFAWSRLEPKPGEFDFGWLDRAIEILAAHGMRVLLGTPTASPPPYLVTAHSDILRVREDGHKVTYGNRREYCPSHPVYREHTRGIVTRMAEHYAAHPAVIGWQIDNEFGDRCYCPVCEESFRRWLRSRYECIETLNRQWGTDFWSHRYSDWSEISVPLTTGNTPNPGLALDYFRFMSDTYIDFQQVQIDIVRGLCPGHLIMHDMMGFKFDRLNYFDLARPLDVVAWNTYPRTQWNMEARVDPSLAALAADTMRGLKHRNFWVTEQQAGSGGWEIVSVPPRPGECRLWAYQSIAHGADAILFFRWRTARFGAEQYWHGLLDHDARPSRRYDEIKQMGAEIRKVGRAVQGASIQAQVAMLLSYDSRFAFQIQPNNPQFSYAKHFRQYYSALYEHHIPIDIAAPTDDLSSYRLVIAPALHVVTEAIAQNLKDYVRSGGVLVVTPRSGVKDDANAVYEQRLPGLLSELCGVEVEEYDSLPPGVENPLAFLTPELENPGPVAGAIWCDVLKPMGAQVVARYTGDFYAGQPAITLNRCGKGQALYVGTFGGAALCERLAGWLLRLAGVQPHFSAPHGVEIAERWQGERRLVFILNHTDEEQRVALDGSYQDLLSDTAPVEGTLTLPAREVRVLAGNSHAD